MSTRSVTHIHKMQSIQDGLEAIVYTFFRHSDGYPSGHGSNLVEYLIGKKLVNGKGIDFTIGRDFNRAGTMAIPLMMHIQNISGAESIPTGTKTSDTEFVYDIYFRENEFYIKITTIYSEESVTVNVDDFDCNKVGSYFYGE